MQLSLPARELPVLPRRRLSLHLRVRLRTVLLLINLFVLALPLGGIFALRIYESALIRQTESELIAQAAFISATYVSFYDRLALRHGPRGRVLPPPADAGLPILYHAPPQSRDGPWRLRNPKLDLAVDPVAPLPPPSQPAAAGDAVAQAIGRELNPILRKAQLYTLAGIRVVDASGVVVASTGEGDDLGRSLADREEIARALRGEPVSLLRRRSAETESPLLESISRGAHIRVNVTQPIERDGRVLGAVLLVRTPANIKQAIYGKRGPLLRATLMLLAIVLALSLLTSLTISRPVQALIRQARRAARGERGAVVPLRHPGTREIAELSETVAAMAHTLEGRAAYIRDFAANVSHEFKTPLTAIRGAVELLRDHDDTLSAGERARFLEMLDADAARLDRLVRRLLELARADVLAPGDERSAVPAVIEDVAARYRELGLGVDAIFDPACQPATAPPVVAMGVDVLDSILTALLDNVRQHAGPQAQARIDCSGDESSVSITVSDDGRGISPGNAERIFEPFFTTARERGGTGLGLAILRALLQAHDGSIERLQRERGAAFRLRIPRGRPA